MDERGVLDGGRVRLSPPFGCVAHRDGDATGVGDGVLDVAGGPPRHHGRDVVNARGAPETECLHQPYAMVRSSATSVDGVASTMS